MTTPPAGEPARSKPSPEEIARVKMRLLLALLAYFAVIVAVVIVVGVLTGNVVIGVASGIGVLVLMPLISTVLRASYQKRKGLAVRGY